MQTRQFGSPLSYSFLNYVILSTLFLTHFFLPTMATLPNVSEPAFDFSTMSRHAPRAEFVNIKEEHEVRSAEEEALRAEELNLKIVQDLRDSEEWFQVIPHSHMTESAFKHSLTGTSLRGIHKILRRPLKFFNANKTKCILVIHLGDQL
jgi:hypothetical protein